MNNFLFISVCLNYFVFFNLFIYLNLVEYGGCDGWFILSFFNLLLINCVDGSVKYVLGVDVFFGYGRDYNVMSGGRL